MCECGYHESLTSDRGNVFQPEFKTCLVCAGVERFARVQYDSDQAAMKAQGDDPAPSAPRPADGRRMLVRRLTEAEVETLREARRPSVSRRSAFAQG